MKKRTMMGIRKQKNEGIYTLIHKTIISLINTN
jgi:hypothetical protein